MCSVRNGGGKGFTAEMPDANVGLFRTSCYEHSIVRELNAREPEYMQVSF